MFIQFGVWMLAQWKVVFQNPGRPKTRLLLTHGLFMCIQHYCISRRIMFHCLWGCSQAHAVDEEPLVGRLGLQIVYYIYIYINMFEMVDWMVVPQRIVRSRQPPARKVLAVGHRIVWDFEGFQHRMAGYQDRVHQKDPQLPSAWGWSVRELLSWLGPNSCMNNPTILMNSGRKLDIKNGYSTWKTPVSIG